MPIQAPANHRDNAYHAQPCLGMSGLVHQSRVDIRMDAKVRAQERLTAGFLKALKPGKHCDGAGLWLVVRDDGGAQWVLRLTVHGRRREMGLGGYPTLGLAAARKLAGRWRDVAAAGRDPIKEREAEERAARREDSSLAVLTADAFEARKAELKGDGTAGRWLSPLALHVLPKLGKVPVTDLDQRDIRDALAPLWRTKADTARKALNRLSIVLRHAAALGLDVDLQATDTAKSTAGQVAACSQEHPRDGVGRRARLLCQPRRADPHACCLAPDDPDRRALDPAAPYPA